MKVKEVLDLHFLITITLPSVKYDLVKDLVDALNHEKINRIGQFAHLSKNTLDQPGPSTNNHGDNGDSDSEETSSKAFHHKEQPKASIISALQERRSQKSPRRGGETSSTFQTERYAI